MNKQRRTEISKIITELESIKSKSFALSMESKTTFPLYLLFFTELTAF